MSNRSRASTDEGTPARRPFLDQNAANGTAGDGAAAGPPTLAPRRATWAEGGPGEKDLDQARAAAEAAFEAWRASSSDGTALVGQGGSEGSGPRLDRTWRKGEEVGAAGHGAGSVRAYGEGRVAVSSRPDGRSSDAERRVYDGAYGDIRGVEDNLPIEDRLQAVMKDLGVPLETCVGTGDRRPARDSREQQLSMVGEGSGTGGRGSAGTTELTAGEAINNRMGEEVRDVSMSSCQHAAVHGGVGKSCFPRVFWDAEGQARQKGKVVLRSPGSPQEFSWADVNDSFYCVGQVALCCAARTPIYGSAVDTHEIGDAKKNCRSCFCIVLQL